MKKRRFSIIRELIPYEEKLKNVKYNKEGIEFEIGIEKYLNTDIYEEYVNLKCVDCGYEEMVDYEIATEIMYYAGDDYPIMECVKCNSKRKVGQMVPVEIYNELKQKP